MPSQSVQASPDQTLTVSAIKEPSKKIEPQKDVPAKATSRCWTLARTAKAAGLLALAGAAAYGFAHATGYSENPTYYHPPFQDAYCTAPFKFNGATPHISQDWFQDTCWESIKDIDVSKVNPKTLPSIFNRARVAGHTQIKELVAKDYCETTWSDPSVPKDISKAWFEGECSGHIKPMRPAPSSLQKDHVAKLFNTVRQVGHNNLKEHLAKDYCTNTWMDPNYIGDVSTSWFQAECVEHVNKISPSKLQKDHLATLFGKVRQLGHDDLKEHIAKDYCEDSWSDPSAIGRLAQSWFEDECFDHVKEMDLSQLKADHLVDIFYEVDDAGHTKLVDYVIGDYCQTPFRASTAIDEISEPWFEQRCWQHIKAQPLPKFQVGYLKELFDRVHRLKYQKIEGLLQEKYCTAPFKTKRAISYLDGGNYQEACWNVLQNQNLQGLSNAYINDLFSKTVDYGYNKLALLLIRNSGQHSHLRLTDENIAKGYDLAFSLGDQTFFGELLGAGYQLPDTKLQEIVDKMTQDKNLVPFLDLIHSHNPDALTEALAVEGLQKAIDNRNVEVIVKLLELYPYSASNLEDGLRKALETRKASLCSPFLKAVFWMKDIEVISKLLKSKKIVTKEKFPNLIENAVRFSKIEILKVLLKKHESYVTDELIQKLFKTSIRFDANGALEVLLDHPLFDREAVSDFLEETSLSWTQSWILNARNSWDTVKGWTNSAYDAGSGAWNGLGNGISGAWNVTSNGWNWAIEWLNFGGTPQIKTAPNEPETKTSPNELTSEQKRIQKIYDDLKGRGKDPARAASLSSSDARQILNTGFLDSCRNIKSAYTKLGRHIHPDKCTKVWEDSCTQWMMMANAAKEVLDLSCS